MPVQRCTKNGTRGWRWGSSGTCYTGQDAKAKAAAQGRAAHAAGYGSKSRAGGTDPMPDPNANAATRKLEKHVDVEDVNAEMGVVFGRAIICTVKGDPYFDTDNEHIPVDVMLRAAADFALNMAVTKGDHADEQGSSVFLWPVTDEVNAACGVSSEWEGLLVGYKPTPDGLAKFKSGEWTGFSIGGEIISAEEA